MKALFTLITLVLASTICICQSNTFLKLNQAPNFPHSISSGGGFQNDSNQFICVYDLYFGASSHQGLLITYDEDGERISNKDKGTTSLGRFSSINNNLFSVSNENNISSNFVYNQYRKLLWKKNDSPNFQNIQALNDSVGFCYADFFKNVGGNTIRDERLAKINLNTGDTIFTKTFSQLLRLPDSTTIYYSLMDISIIDTNIFLLFQDNLNKNLSLSRYNLLGNKFSTKNINVGLFDQQLYSKKDGVILLSFHNNAKNFWLKEYKNEALNLIDSGAFEYQLSRNKVLVDQEQNIHLCLKHFPTNGIDNFVEIRVYNESFELKKSIKYSIPNEDIWLNMSIATDGGYFFTGSSSYLNPENNAFIMKTDSNGLVENPTLFPLQIDTSLSNTTINVNDINPTKTFTVYPNPVNTTLSLFGNIQTLKLIKLLDLKGNILFSNLPSKNIDLSRLSQGIYILEIENQKREIERHKIIKQ